MAQAPPHPARPAIRTGVLHANYNPGLPTLFLIGDSTVTAAQGSANVTVHIPLHGRAFR